MYTIYDYVMIARKTPAKVGDDKLRMKSSSVRDSNGWTTEKSHYESHETQIRVNNWKCSKHGSVH